MRTKKRKITSLLKYVADLLRLINSLKDENEELTRKNEKLQQDIARHKTYVQAEKLEMKDFKPTAEKERSLIRYKTATILYAEIRGSQNFTDNPDNIALVDSLDEILIKLQEVIARYNIKKIKTVGDSFICIGGIPKKNLANPVHVLLAAIEMQYLIKDLYRSDQNRDIWKLRIAVHTGTITADIRNTKSQHYDVKGTTVDLAARIRHVCQDNQIIISGNTYELVKDFFRCDYCNKIPVKYQGFMQLFSVNGIKTEFSLKGKGIIPNKSMSIRIGLMQFMDLQELILDKMEKELPPDLYYHNVKHTVDVVTQVELIGLGENVSDEELLLLKTAALFHDIGHVISYDNHEYFSTLIAREMLWEFNYTQAQTEKVCELIMATKLPPKPSNKLEAIICDADLDYLGRSDMIPVSNSLYFEMKERRIVDSLNDWNAMQIKFISGHQYFTETARNLRDVNKQMQIERIKNLIVENAE
ncbi:MAG: HD domain-containing protein [Bacteroidales bacterium]|nr:HD domain-containing protein [Bacteroidales bacterium]